MRNDIMPSAAETRKRRLWQEMVYWLRIELNSRFSLQLCSLEDMHNIEDMAKTLVNSGELFDKHTQSELESMEKADSAKLFTALQTPVFIKTPPDAVMSAKDVIALYDQLAGINDEIEYGDDGYVRFGSANDADQFRQIVADIEARRNALVFPDPANKTEKRDE